MSVLTPLQAMGIKVKLAGSGRLRIQGRSSQLCQSQMIMAVKYARTHKQAILAALTQGGVPGQCESCPAAGYWDHSVYTGQGLLCFHHAYYLGKPGYPNRPHVMTDKDGVDHVIQRHYEHTEERRNGQFYQQTADPLVVEYRATFISHHDESCSLSARNRCRLFQFIERRCQVL